MRPWRWIWFLVVVLAIATACSGPPTAESESESEELAETLPQAASATVSNLVSDPAEYEGVTVAVVGEMGPWYQPTVTELRSCTLLDCNATLVVGVTQSDVQDAVDSDVPVRVVGTVRRLTEDTELPGLDPSDAAYAQFLGGPVIVATSAVGLTVDALGSASSDLMQELSSAPAEFIGREVGFQGEIQRVLAARVFTVVDSFEPSSGSVALVYATSPDLLNSPAESGDAVQVRGEVRWFDQAQLEAATGEALPTGESYPSFDGKAMIAADAIWVNQTGVPVAPTLQFFGPATSDDELGRLAVIDDGSQYAGTWMQVSGEVLSYVGEQGLGFTLGGLAPYWPLDEGRAVLIGGQVATFEQAASEALYDVQFDNAAYAPYEGKPAIRAEWIRLIPRAQVESVQRSTLRAIDQSPDQYMGLLMTVAGGVDRLYGDRAFVLTTGLLGAELLVVQSADPPGSITQGTTVRATGILESFDAASIEQRIGATLPSDLTSRFSGKPVLLASRTETLP
jgi:hypothetical protein